MERLTKSEEIVFCALNRLGGKMLKTKDILQYLENKGYTWKIQTVSTFLTHLVRKGYIRTSMRGKKSYYYSVCTNMEEEYKKHKLNEFIDFWYNGDILAFAADVVEKG